MLYRTQFERFNFDFEPRLHQTSDVVFDVSDDASLEEIESAAWKACWEQNPHWGEHDPPVIGFGYGGWSSVMQVEYGKFTTIEKYEDIDLGVVGEGNPRICETFTVNGEGSWRVTSFYKNSNGKIRNGKITIENCSRDEAEYVGGAGICGTIKRIEDITMTGVVDWPNRRIVKYRKAYNNRPFGRTVNKHVYWL